MQTFWNQNPKINSIEQIDFTPVDRLPYVNWRLQWSEDYGLETRKCHIMTKPKKTQNSWTVCRSGLCCASYCQMLSAGSFDGVERWSLRQIYYENIFLTSSAYRSPKIAFYSVKLGKMPFWGLPWAKIVRNICFRDKYALSYLWVENRELKNYEVAW